jgi:hypothetical protein
MKKDIRDFDQETISGIPCTDAMLTRLENKFQPKRVKLEYSDGGPDGYDAWKDEQY